MSPICPTKRRRIDNATHTLSQPFKSPFKTPLKDKTNTQPTTSSPTKSPPITPQSTKIPPITTSTTAAASPPPSTTHPIPPNNPTYPTLRGHHMHLLTHLTHIRTSLETSTQALKIESSSRETELEALIQKWKVASRAAAEEVFAKARDRVNKMGGVGVLREKEREKSRGGMGWGWDEGERKEGEGEGDGDGDTEDGAGFRGGEYEGEREEGEGKVEDEVGDDEGYTMDMMLKALNIELDIIGYDKWLQKWVD